MPQCGIHGATIPRCGIGVNGQPDRPGLACPGHRLAGRPGAGRSSAGRPGRSRPARGGSRAGPSSHAAPAGTSVETSRDDRKATGAAPRLVRRSSWESARRRCGLSIHEIARTMGGSTPSAVGARLQQPGEWSARIEDPPLGTVAGGFAVPESRSSGPASPAGPAPAAATGTTAVGVARTLRTGRVVRWQRARAARRRSRTPRRGTRRLAAARGTTGAPAGTMAGLPPRAPARRVAPQRRSVARRPPLDLTGRLNEIRTGAATKRSRSSSRDSLRPQPGILVDAASAAKDPGLADRKAGPALATGRPYPAPCSIDRSGASGGARST